MAGLNRLPPGARILSLVPRNAVTRSRDGDRSHRGLEVVPRTPGPGGFRFWLLILLAACGTAGAEPERVMFIHSFGRDFAPYNTFSAVLRTELVSRYPGPLDLLDVSLESARSDDPEQEALLVNYLAALSAMRRVDLVIPIGGPAAAFARRHREKLFSGTPIPPAALAPRHIRPDTLTADDAVVAANIEPTRVVETILQLLPETKNVVVVVGASPLDKFWKEQLRADLQSYADRLNFQWLDQYSFDEMLERCADLPPRTAIFYALLAVDAKGVPLGDERVLARLHSTANAPIFGIFESQIGQGIVGGPVVDMSEMSRNTAAVASRILNGEPAGGIRPPPQGMSAPRFDGRELQRWGIGHGRLPAGSVVRFRERGLWERHWPLLCVGILFVATQAMLIVGLLVNRTKRRQGELAARLTAELSSKFINLPADRVDPEIEAAQRKICEQLGFDISTLWQWSAEHPDDLLLTHFCRFVDGPPIPDRMSAQEHFPWCLHEVKANRRITLASLDHAPSEAARDGESFRHFGITSNLTIPLVIGEGPPLGALSFGVMRAGRAWRDEVVERLEVVAQIFANALARKRAEHELREGEARLNLAADAAAAGLWRLDLATRCFWLTDRTRELFEFLPDEVVTLERFLGQVHPEDRNFVKGRVGELVESKDEGQAEYRVLLRDGRIKWMRSQGRVHANTSDQPDYLMGVTVDITSNKRAEETLRNFSARLISHQEAERARLARALHDDITQRLACLAIDVGQSESGTSSRSPEETRRSVREELIRLGEDVHALSYRLHPSILYELGLPAALRAEAERFERQGPATIHLTFHALPESVPSDVSLCLFRIAQEALRNAERHAGARMIKLSLLGLDGGMQLAVEDDGCGFDPAAQIDHPSLGLSSMRERVRLLDGDLEIESSPNHGTTVLARVPVKAEEPAPTAPDDQAKDPPDRSLSSTNLP